MFFGTPHSGANTGYLTMAKIASKIARSFLYKRGDDIIEVVDQNSKYTQMHQELWRNQLQRYKIVSFWGNRDDVSLITRFTDIIFSILTDTVTTDSSQEKFNI